MAKVKRVAGTDAKFGAWALECLGCEGRHVIYVGEWTDHGGNKKTGWKFDGNVDAPTFHPSLLIYETKHEGVVFQPRCHSFIRDGKIQYLADCGHALAGQTVELPDIT